MSQLVPLHFFGIDFFRHRQWYTMPHHVLLVSSSYFKSCFKLSVCYEACEKWRERRRTYQRRIEAMGQVVCKEPMDAEDEFRLDCMQAGHVETEFDRKPLAAMQVGSLQSLEDERINPYSALQEEGICSVVSDGGCQCVQGEAPTEFILAETPDSAVILCEGRKGAELISYPSQTDPTTLHQA
eukprot:s797_g6.t1